MESSNIPDCTKETAKDIKPINKDTVHRICSGQVRENLFKILSFITF